MKTNKLYTILLTSAIILFCFMSSGTVVSQISNHPQQDTTRMKDPINRMHDSTRLRQMMRDSNFMKKPNHNLKDSMPMKKGWMDEDSTSDNSTTVYVYSY